MAETAPELLLDDDDDFVFEPTGWELATTIGLRVDPEADREALDELADAMLVWAEDAEADRLKEEAANAIWDDELAKQLRHELSRVAELGLEWKSAAAAALEELDLLGCRSELAREVTAHLAMQLSQLDHPWTFCVCCIDETLPLTPPEQRRALARRVALVARRNAGVPEFEVRAAFVGVSSEPPVVRLATDARRVAVRERLGRIGRLARTSMPLLASELEAIAAEPLPARPEDDDVWSEVCEHLAQEVMRPVWN